MAKAKALVVKAPMAKGKASVAKVSDSKAKSLVAKANSKALMAKAKLLVAKARDKVGKREPILKVGEVLGKASERGISQITFNCELCAARHAVPAYQSDMCNARFRMGRLTPVECITEP